jgi:hypothetical protein
MAGKRADMVAFPSAGTSSPGLTGLMLRSRASARRLEV